MLLMGRSTARDLLLTFKFADALCSMTDKKHNMEAAAKGVTLRGQSQKGAKYRLYTCNGCGSSLDLRTDNVRAGQFTCKGCGSVVPTDEQVIRKVRGALAEVQAPGEPNLLTVIYPYTMIFGEAPEGTAFRIVTSAQVARVDVRELRRIEKSIWASELTESSLVARCYPASLRSRMVEALDAFSL